MQVEIGTIVNGKVTGITDFGAFVEFEGRKTGLVHISEVSSEYVKDIKEHLHIGQEVKAKIIAVTPEGKISLSIKQVEMEEKGEKTERKSDSKTDRKPQFQKNNNNHTRNSNPNVWTGAKTKNNHSGEKQSFEDMMASFKKASEEKMSDLKRADSKRGSVGYSRRGRG